MARGYRKHQAFTVSSEKALQSVLQRVQRVLEGRTLAPVTEHRHYLDTFDWRIHRAGGALSQSPEQGTASLHWSSNGHEPLSAESRRPPEFASDLPAGRLREELEPIVAPRRLLSIADLVRTSQTVELLDVEGKIVCRVTASTSELDGVHIGPPSYKIILEGVRGYEDEFQTLDRFLRYQLQLPLSNTQEIEDVFARLDRSAGKDPSALDIELSKRLTAGGAVRLVLATLCDVLLVNRGGVLDRLDIEFLHDFRVAVRRTRSVLSQMGDVLPATVVKHYGREFRWLGALTGPARDLDVFLENLPGYRSTLPAEDADSLDPLARLLKRERRKAQGALDKGLKSDRFEKLVSNWRNFLLEPPQAESNSPALADVPVRQLSRRRTWKRYRKVRDGGRRIDRSTSGEELHALRIQCKKLRYMLEVFRSLHPADEITPCIKELKRIQNTLGEFNDALVHAGMLRSFATHVGGDDAARTSVAIGILVSDLTRRAEEQRLRFFERFARFDSESNGKLFKKLLKAGGTRS